MSSRFQEANHALNASLVSLSQGVMANVRPWLYNLNSLQLSVALVHGVSA